MASAQDHREFVRNWNEQVWRQGNLDVIDDLVADDFVARDPGRPEPVRGPDGVREMVEVVRSAFPDVDVELQDCIVENDRIAVRNTITGTHDGEYFGIEATGESVEVDVVAFQRIEDRRYVEEWRLLDSLSFLQQLGIVEPPTG